MKSRRGLPSLSELQRIVRRYAGFTCEGNAIKCLVCETALLSWHASDIKRHMRCKRHVENSRLQVPYEVFLYDLFFVLTVCNIPFNALDNEHFQVFWKKYAPKWKLPSRGVLRNKMPHVKRHMENNIREDLRNKKVWITVDETTDIKNNKVGNVLVRILTATHATASYVLASKRLKEITGDTIEHLVRDTIDCFKIEKHNILLLVTDGAAYMRKAARALQQLYPNALHLTCIVHDLRLVAETVWNSYPDVDALIAANEKVFWKAPQRLNAFHATCPEVPKPPRPILTRWETWLKAAFYYSENFDMVKAVVDTFDSTEAAVIQVSQLHFSQPQVAADLRAIRENYTILANAIDKLQESSLSLVEAFDIVNTVSTSLETLTDTPGITAAAKFHALLNKNPGLRQLRHINQCLSANHPTSDIQQYYAYANITSVDVERSFSQYCLTFTDRRTCFNESTVETILMLRAYGVHHPFQ